MSGYGTGGYRVRCRSTIGCVECDRKRLQRVVQPTAPTGADQRNDVRTLRGHPSDRELRDGDAMPLRDGDAMPLRDGDAMPLRERRRVLDEREIPVKVATLSSSSALPYTSPDIPIRGRVQ